MTKYASSREVYRELRATITPWCKSAGWSREPGSEAAWFHLLGDDRRVLVFFACGSWGSSDTGNTLNGDVHLTPLAGPANRAPWARSTAFTRCLLRAELDELASIQTEVNRRRPPAPVILRQKAADDATHARHLRKLYEPVAEPYREGEYVPFNYYSVRDVQDFASFIARHFPAVVKRFIDNRCPAPIFAS